MTMHRDAFDEPAGGTVLTPTRWWPCVRRGVRSEACAEVRAGRITVAAAVMVVVLFGVLAFQHRWISDDGLIVAREVRQILAGAGPNYNPFQRDEVDTSALWTWLLAAFALVRGGHVAVDAVTLGLVLAVAGLVLALAGSVNAHRQRGATGVIWPVGALVPVAIGGFWDFATSGLESGLSLFWLALAWWLLVSVTEDVGRARLIAVAVVVGVGPLVRPDFALASAVFGIAAVLIVRPGWWRGLVYAGVGALLPVGYQVFRMGYYGITVPMPGLAKEAGSSRWAHGLGYLIDFMDAYLVWIPLLLIVVVGARVLSRTAIDRRSAALMATPVLAGVLLGVYVVKVGGDYMHARMWVPVAFTLLLPVMTLPVGRGRRAASVLAALILMWALIAGLCLRPPYQGKEFGAGGVVDERGFETIEYSQLHPITTDSRTRDNDLSTTLTSLTGNGRHKMAVSTGKCACGTPWTIPVSPSLPDHSVFFYDNMGVADAVMSLSGTVVDVNGLASPLAGHLLLQQRGRPGHEKWLPPAWAVAEYADPVAITTMTDTPDVTKAQVGAARHALSCGDLKELVDSVDQPMSISRFWDNLIGAPSRTDLRVPGDPFAAERQFCHH